mmetsp:Transcript_114289/g.198719  ORF Transcript_114289/g.198719 Transcript_114289/m.198719 type:complete len:303 (-) Transcript_114289:363-1271(-)
MPKIASFAVAFFSSFLSMKSMKAPHSSSMRPNVARLFPVTYPTQSCGIVRTVTSSRPSVSISTIPSNCFMTQPKYSPAVSRSLLVPDMWTQLPTYSTIHPEARANFFLVAPFLPRAQDTSSIFNLTISVPQSSESDVCSSMCSVRCPSRRLSIAAITFNSAPRRARRSPNIANRSSPRRSRSDSPFRCTKNIIVPYSCSTIRKKAPLVPVTNPQHSVGTGTMVQSFSKCGSLSSTMTSPTLCAITHSTYFFARLLASGSPVISSFSDRCGNSRVAPDTRPIFSLVLPPLPRMKAASASVSCT